jgi:hypothetical protein
MRLTPQLEDVAIALTIFVFLFTITSIRSLAKGNWRVKNANHDQALYEDEDGAASTESAEAFSNKLQFILIFVFAVVGLGLSVADSVFALVEAVSSTSSSNPRHVGIFLLFPAWVRPNSC